MERVTDILIRFAKGRMRALDFGRKCSLSEAEAATKIIRTADYFRAKPQAVQLRCIQQIEPELRLLLPAEESRFKKLRKRILDLIDLSHHPHESMEKPTPA